MALPPLRLDTSSPLSEGKKTVPIVLESATSHRDEESEWSEITQTGSPTGFVLGLGSSAAVLHSWAAEDARWLWGHLAAYLPGFPEGLAHCRLLPHTEPRMGEYHLPGTQLGWGHFPL